MGFLNWLNRNAAPHNEQGHAWERLGVYLYRADGRYPPATWAETPQQFAKMIRQIRKHVDKKLEVRITNTDDHLLFHATEKGIEWDGLALTPLLDHDRQNRNPLDELKEELNNAVKKSRSPDR